MYTTAFRDIGYGLVISIILMLIGLTPVAPFLRTQAAQIITPLQYGFSAVGQRVDDQITFFRAVTTLQQRNTVLEKENTQLAGELAALSEVARENDLLRTQLGDSLSVTSSYRLARVIGRGVQESDAIIKVDQGSADGVVPGAVVVIGAHLVGQVTDDVHDTFSFVRLVTDSDLRVAALDQDSPERAKGVVRGQYSTVMVMEKVFHDETITVGDTIITSGEDGVFPKGLVIGTVQEVLSDEGEGILKEAQVAPVVPVNNVEEVFIAVTEETV